MRAGHAKTMGTHNNLDSRETGSRSARNYLAPTESNDYFLVGTIPYNYIFQQGMADARDPELLLDFQSLSLWQKIGSEDWSAC